MKLETKVHLVVGHLNMFSADLLINWVLFCLDLRGCVPSVWWWNQTRHVASRFGWSSTGAVNVQPNIPW